MPVILGTASATQPPQGEALTEPASSSSRTLTTPTSTSTSSPSTEGAFTRAAKVGRIGPTASSSNNENPAPTGFSVPPGSLKQEDAKDKPELFVLSEEDEQKAELSENALKQHEQQHADPPCQGVEQVQGKPSSELSQVTARTARSTTSTRSRLRKELERARAEEAALAATAKRVALEQALEASS